MKTTLLVIGNELLNGKIKDLNTQFLAKKLHQLGFTLNHVQITPDKPESFLQYFDYAFNHNDVVITCGGLGPTQDDVTKNMLAQYFKRNIEFSQQALDITLSHFNRTNREYNQNSFHYHNIPSGFEVLSNPAGYAPGLKFQTDNKQIFALPGVPSEFQAMLLESILPSLKTNSQNILKHVIVKTWKIPESKIFHELEPAIWEKLETYGEVSSLPHIMGVDLAVKLSRSSQSEIDKAEKEIIDIFQASNLAANIWHIGPESLEEIIIYEAQTKNLTIGFSESCTGGLCASRITDIGGSSSVFWGSVVSYSNEVKMKSLNVSVQTLKDHGAVSEQTAFEMAQGAREHLQVDIAVSTTGVAGPGGGSKEKPVGTVGIGVSSKNGTKSKLYQFRGDRELLKRRFSEKALISLLEEIRSL